MGQKQTDTYARKVKSYQPSMEIKRRIRRTEEHAELLKSRLSKVLRSTYSKRQYANFLRHVGRFSQEAVKNKHLPFDDSYEFKATDTIPCLQGAKHPTHFPYLYFHR